LATSKPSIRSSPWIRGAPSSLLIRRIRSRRPRSILGRRQYGRNHQGALRRSGLSQAHGYRRASRIAPNSALTDILGSEREPRRQPPPGSPPASPCRPSL
jgi:hypothetical protein